MGRHRKNSNIKNTTINTTNEEVCYDRSGSGQGPGQGNEQDSKQTGRGKKQLSKSNNHNLSKSSGTDNRSSTNVKNGSLSKWLEKKGLDNNYNNHNLDLGSGPGGKTTDLIKSVEFTKPIEQIEELEPIKELEPIEELSARDFNELVLNDGDTVEVIERGITPSQGRNLLQLDQQRVVSLVKQREQICSIFYEAKLSDPNKIFADAKDMDWDTFTKVTSRLDRTSEIKIDHNITAMGILGLLNGK